VSSSRADVVVVAAGRSSRMNGIDKLTAPIGGRPLLAWTLAAFTDPERIGRIVVVAAPERVIELRSADWLPPIATVVPGAERRQESVAAGVAELEARGTADDAIVLVHDGARPAAGSALISSVIDAAAAHGAAIPVLPLVDTLKRVADDQVAATVDRVGLGTAQTPQGVRLSVLRSAYARYPPSGPETFTDEAGLLEACTIPVHVVPGHIDNLKVTYPIDLARTAAVLDADAARVGLGEDVHGFGPGSPLAIGGIEITGAPRLHGHSDGDVVLHAVAAALLGAAGLPDLGSRFPADGRTPVGVASADLVTDVVGAVHAAGFRPVRIDVSITGARPRLGHRLEDIRGRIASLVGLPSQAVAVKGSTGNLAGPEGAGRAISARVVATLRATRS
jgi:2-C-methyl-D-erythritol 4-phosphate cytidylyltransferase / 2-C-methyl-D-erythritol 2,4-cyclodiphosphate synthase